MTHSDRAPTAEQREMARRIAAQYYRDAGWPTLPGLVDSGQVDFDPAVRSALAAIIETQEADAKLAEWAHMVPPDGGSPTPEECALAETISTAIRAGHHYGRTSHD